MPYDMTVTWDNNNKRSKIGPDHISTKTAHVTLRKERLCSVSVLQRVSFCNIA
jgi:hypothetical protein